jgi:predicted MFS family arabinose efflux permease
MICGSGLGGRLSETVGYSGVATMAGFITLLVIPLNYMIMPAERTKEDVHDGVDKVETSSKGINLGRVFTLLRDPRVFVVFLFQMCLGIGTSVFQSMAPMIAKEDLGMDAT